MKLYNRLLNFSLLIGLFTLISMNGCTKTTMNCLPYEGEVIGKDLCSLLIIKVTNKEVDSQYLLGNERLSNVIGAVKIEVPSIDPSIISQSKKVYFDFREATDEERYPCPAIFSIPSRRIVITRISNSPCPSINP